jgi:hypothetical protein
MCAQAARASIVFFAPCCFALCLTHAPVISFGVALRRLAMSKTFQHTIWVLVLIASGVLVTACQPEKKTSSAKAAEQTAPPKAEGAPKAEPPSVIERIFSPSKPATPTKSTHAKPTHAKPTHAKPKVHANAKTATKSSAKPSDTKKQGFTSYGTGAEGAGITDPTDTAKTAKGTTGSVGK